MPTNNRRLNPNKWVELQPNDSEKIIGVIFKAKHTKLSAAVVIRRLEQKLDKEFDIKDLPATLIKTFRQNINGFGLISSKLTKIGRYRVVQIQYQRSKRGETYADSMLVVPTPTQTIYITMGAKKADSKLVQKDFPRINLGFLSDIFS